MNIGGLDRPIKMGLNQSIAYCELRGISITQMNKEFKRFTDGMHSGSEVRDLIWSALKDGARKAKVEFPYDNLDVGDWIEDIKPEAVIEFINKLSTTLPKADGRPNSKKKVTVPKT